MGKKITKIGKRPSAAWRRAALIIFAVVGGMTFTRPGENVLCAQQDVAFTATVDRKVVPLGSYCQLILTVTGAQAVSPIALPQIDGFQVRYLGPATRVSIINGAQFSSVSFMYNLYPTKAGKFQIPAFAINVEGQPFTSEAIPIEVVASDAAAGQAAAQSLSEKIFIIMGTPKSEVYLNERVPLAIKLFVNDLRVKDIQYPEFNHLGFSVDEYQEPQQSEQVIGGIAYRVVEFKTYVYPTRTGQLSLGPGKLSCSLLLKNPSSENRGEPFERLFDDEILDGVFGSYQVQPMTVESADLALTVKALPEEGRPQGFSGAVGKFDFDASVSPGQVKVGDPVTLRMTISGDGNLQAVNMPDVKDFLKDKTAFKLYDPIVSQKDGKKILEQVLIPAHERVNEIPAMTFSYFNPDEQKYQTISRGPFPLAVQPLAQGEGLKVVGLQEGQKPQAMDEESFGEDISFIKERPGTWVRNNSWVYQRPWFWLLAATAAAAWGGLWGFYLFTVRIRTDRRFARRMLAPAKARKGLQHAEELLNGEQAKEFYDVLFKTLQEYFGNKLHLSAGSVSAEAVHKHIQGKNVNGSALTQLEDFLQECDRVRFGSVTPDPAKMRDHYQAVRQLIDYLERKG